jgi:uncharacterized protein
MYSLTKITFCLIVILVSVPCCLAQKSRAQKRTLKQNADGYTALMRAARSGQLNTVRALLKKGAKVNAQNDIGLTALMLASAEGHLEVVKALLAAGADPNLRAASFHFGDSTALTGALDAGAATGIKVIDALIAAGAEVNPMNAGRTPLMRAIEKKDLAMMEALLKRGAEINWKNQQGFTPLMAAVLASSPEALNFLINADADLNARSNDGQTALSLAEGMYAEFGLSSQAEVVRILKAAGARP